MATSSIRGASKKNEKVDNENAEVGKQTVGTDSKAMAASQRGSTLKSNGTLRAATNKNATTPSTKPISSPAKPSQPSIAAGTPKSTASTSRPSTGTIPRTAPNRTSDGQQTKSLTRQPAARPVLRKSTGPITETKGTEPAKKVSAATLKRLAANKGAGGGGRPSTPTNINSPGKPDETPLPSQSPSSKRSSTFRNSKTEDEIIEQSGQPETPSSPVFPVERADVTTTDAALNSEDKEPSLGPQDSSADSSLIVPRRFTALSVASSDSDQEEDLESTEQTAYPLTSPASPVTAASESSGQAKIEPASIVNGMPQSTVPPGALDQNMEKKSDSLLIIELKSRVSTLAADNAKKAELIDHLFASQMQLKDEVKEISRIPGGLKSLYDQIAAATNAANNQNEARRRLKEEVAALKRESIDTAKDFEKIMLESKKTIDDLRRKLLSDKAEEARKVILERDTLTAKLKDEIAKMDDQREEAQQGRLSAENKLEEATNDKSALEAECSKLREEQDKARRTFDLSIAEWRQQMYEADVAWSEHEKQWFADLGQLSTEVDGLQSQLKESGAASAELQERLSKTEAELEASLKVKDDLKAEQTELKSKIDRLSRDLTSWTELAVDPETFKHQAELIELGTNYTDLEDQYNGAKARIRAHGRFTWEIAATLGFGGPYEESEDPEKRYDAILQELDRLIERHRCEHLSTGNQLAQLRTQLKSSQRFLSELYVDVTKHNCNVSKNQFAPPIKAGLFRTLEKIATSQGPSDFTASFTPAMANNVAETENVDKLREAELQARKRTDAHINMAKQMARTAVEILGMKPKSEYPGTDAYDSMAASGARAEVHESRLDQRGSDRIVVNLGSGLTSSTDQMNSEDTSLHVGHATPSISERTALDSNPTATTPELDPSRVSTTNEHPATSSTSEQLAEAEPQPEFHEPSMQADWVVMDRAEGNEDLPWEELDTA